VILVNQKEEGLDATTSLCPYCLLFYIFGQPYGLWLNQPNANSVLKQSNCIYEQLFRTIIVNRLAMCKWEEVSKCETLNLRRDGAQIIPRFQSLTGSHLTLPYVSPKCNKGSTDLQGRDFEPLGQS
jgi:hypothetical protein